MILLAAVELTMFKVADLILPLFLVACGDAKAPAVRKVAGVGSVDGITARVFEALK